MIAKLLSQCPIPQHPAQAVVDTTKLKCFMECPRKFFFNYLLGWDSENISPHLKFGEAIHEALAFLYENGMSEELAYDAWRDHFMPIWLEAFDPAMDEIRHPKTAANAMRLIAGYVGTYKNDFAKFTPLMIEIAGSVPINSDRRLHFRMDSVMQSTEDGSIFSLEHKTSQSLSASWENEFRLAPQVGTYTHALYAHFGYPDMKRVKGVMINGLGISRAKTSTIDFKRLKCWRTMRQMQQWLAMANFWYAQIESELEMLSEDSSSNDIMSSFPQNPTSCSNWAGCYYLDLCTAWSNPLQRCDNPPPGMTVRFWDPSEKPAKVQLALNGEGSNNVDV